MMSKTLINNLRESKKQGLKKLGVLLDPDKLEPATFSSFISSFKKAGVDFILIGGSLLTQSSFHEVVSQVKNETDLPIILFPSNTYQINEAADAILFLSLISGRNPDLLIGKHVEAAPMLQHSNLEIIPTGYMLIDGGAPTTASYISNTLPIPSNKPEIAACTALAGQFLGLQAMYLDAGSGANNPVSQKMIQTVNETINIPLIVGGGIRTPELAYNAAIAGADLIIVGNALEEDPELIWKLSTAIKTAETNTLKTSVHA